MSWIFIFENVILSWTNVSKMFNKWFVLYRAMWRKNFCVCTSFIYKTIKIISLVRDIQHAFCSCNFVASGNTVGSMRVFELHVTSFLSKSLGDGNYVLSLSRISRRELNLPWNFFFIPYLVRNYCNFVHWACSKCIFRLLSKHLNQVRSGFVVFFCGKKLKSLQLTT